MVSARSRTRSRRLPSSAVVTSSSGNNNDIEVENCSGCLKPESCPCPKAIRRSRNKARQRESEAANAPDDVDESNEPTSSRVRRRALLASFVATAGVVVDNDNNVAFAMSNGLVSDAWATISGAPSDLTFPDDFAGTWLCYSTLTAVDTPQGEGLLQDRAVVDRARRDVGNQIIYPMRFIKNNQGKVVMDRAYNVVRMAEATAKAYNIMDSIEWDVDDPNVLKANLSSDGRTVFFRVNQRSEEYPAPDRIETSEVAQIVFDGGDNGGYAPATPESTTPPPSVEDNNDFAGAASSMMGTATGAGMGGGGANSSSRVNQPKIKSSRTFTKWKFRSVESAGDGPAIVASQTVYDYLTSFDPGFMESKGQPVTQYTYKLALFKANKTNLEN